MPNPSLPYLLPPLVAGGIISVLVIVVLLWSRRDFSRALFCAFLASLAIWDFLTYGMRASPDPEHALVWEKALIVPALAAFITYYHFTLVYTSTRSQRVLLRAAYGLLVLVAALAPTEVLLRGMRIESYGYAPILTPAGYISLGIGSFLIVGGVSNLLRQYRASTSYEEHNRLAYLTIAVAFPLIGAVLDASTNLPPLNIWANLLFAVLCTIAILRYHLLDIRVVIRKSLAYLVMSAIVALPYLGTLLLIDTALGTTTEPWWVHVGAILVVATVIGPLHSWAQRLVDRLFYREQYNYLKALEEFGRRAQSIVNLQELGSDIVRLAGGALHTTSASLLLPSEAGEGLVVASTVGLEDPPTGIILARHSPLLRWLRAHGRIVSSREFDIAPELQSLASRDRQNLARLGGELYVPMRTAEGELSGVLALGQKLSRQPYSNEDRHLLAALASQTAMALENARLFDKSQREVLERKQVEEKLRLTFESIAEGIVVMDLEGNIVQVNEAAVRIRGSTSRGELVGRSLFDLVASADRDRAKENLQATLANGPTRDREYAFRRQDGEEFPVRLSTAVLKDASGHPTGFVAVVEDVTEARKMEEQLRHSQLLASLGEMTAGIAHEVNNPLGSVLLYSELLLENELPKQAKKDLKVVYSEAKRAARIMTDLLSYSRRVKSQERRTDLHRIIRRVLEMRRYAQTVRNITVSTSLVDGPLPVRGNASQLTQVFMNLIVNAEEALANSEQKRIVVTSSIEGDWARVSVADSGIGIPEENLNQVFYPFFSTKQKMYGTGLGLSTAYGIVTQHKGLIRAENNDMGGATFIVELPLAKLRVRREEPSEQQEPTEEQPAPAMASQTSR